MEAVAGRQRPALTVREAVPDDAGAIGRIKRDGWRAAYRGLLPDSALDALDADVIAAQVRGWLLDETDRTGGGRCSLVAERDGVVEGYLMAGPYRWDDLPGAGEVYAVYVDPACWGGGAGRALLAAAEERLLAQGHHEAALWVLDGNHRGRGFYEAVGWRCDGTTGERCEVDGAPEVRYRRRLA